MDEFKLSNSSKIIIMTAVLASLLEIIDTSIVNVAIPSMMGNLGSTLEDISWVVTGYIIANAIVLPIAGWLGMQVGRRKYYIGCILLFTTMSVACGLAPNLVTLVICRVFQGFFGGALLPTSQALIQEQFPRERAGMASAIYGMGVMIGPTLGPTMGGYLTDNFGWRMIFNINLPLGLLAAALAFWKIPNLPAAPVAPAADPAKPVVKPSIDVWGLVLLCVGIGCLQYVLERGQADDWFDSASIVICTIAAIVAIPTFIWWELRVKSPIIDIRLFSHNAVRSGTLLMTAVGMMLYSTVFVLPIFCNNILGLDATQTGMLFIPGALLTGLMMPFVGSQLKKRDARLLIFVGLFVIEIFLVQMTHFNSLTGAEHMFVPLLVRGVGMAFLFVPINAVVLGQFTGAQLGQVAGVMNLSRQIGGSIGIASLSTLLQRLSVQNYQDLTSHVTLLNNATWQTYQQARAALVGKMSEELGFATTHDIALRQIAFRIQRQVFCLSFEQIVWYLIIAFVLALIPLALLRVDKKIVGPVDAH
jgi:DHA2 family multidrug resistance protein